MTAAMTENRDEMIARYVALDALGFLLSNIALELVPDDLLPLASDSLVVGDPAGDLDSLSRDIWPSDSDYEDTVEWKLAHARSCMTTARMCSVLASDAGVAWLRNEADRMAATSIEFVEQGINLMQRDHDAA